MILNELLTVMQNQNPIGGVSQIIQNNGPVQLKQNEIDEIFVIKLLKNFKENPKIPQIFFSELKIQFPRLYSYVSIYFRSLLIKVYKYNKNQDATEENFTLCISKLSSFYN